MREVDGDDDVGGAPPRAGYLLDAYDVAQRDDDLAPEVGDGERVVEQGEQDFRLAYLRASRKKPAVNPTSMTLAISGMSAVAERSTTVITQITDPSATGGMTNFAKTVHSVEMTRRSPVTRRWYQEIQRRVRLSALTAPTDGC